MMAVRACGPRGRYNTALHVIMDDGLYAALTEVAEIRRTSLAGYVRQTLMESVRRDRRDDREFEGLTPATKVT